jgi:TM2 domain-containing membrane protein YozV
MKIFLTIIISSCILNAFAQKGQDINKELLSIEYSIWNTQDKKDVSNLIITKAQMLTENGFFNEAIIELDRIKDFSSIDTNQLFYKKSFNNFMIGDYNNAYNQMLDISDSIRLHEKDYLTLWLFILNEIDRWDECKQLMLSIDTTGLLNPKINELPVEINYKSPIKAKHFSGFFPGIGQFYTGYPAKGITSILLHAAFCLVTIESIISGMYITGIVYGLSPVIRLYMGGKQSSYRFAEENNNKQILEIKKKYLNTIQLLMEK